jgi:cytidine deaminase
MAPSLLSLTSSPHPPSLSSITPSELASLASLSAAAKERAYCPYSKFRVGAALLSDSDSSSSTTSPTTSTPTSTTSPSSGPHYISGANIENASYPVGICAERSALSRAIVDGHRRFRAIAVSTDISPPASPCGMCRQFIREFCNPDTPVIMFDKNQDYVVMTVEEVSAIFPFIVYPYTPPPPIMCQTDRHDTSFFPCRLVRTRFRHRLEYGLARTCF